MTEPLTVHQQKARMRHAVRMALANAKNNTEVQCQEAIQQAAQTFGLAFVIARVLFLQTDAHGEGRYAEYAVLINGDAWEDQVFGKVGELHPKLPEALVEVHMRPETLKSWGKD